MPGTVKLELDGILLDEFRYRGKKDRSDWMHRKRIKKCYQGEAKQKMYFTITPDEIRFQHGLGDVEWIKKLIAKNYTIREIADEMEVAFLTVQRWVRQYKLSKPMRSYIGRPRKSYVNNKL